MLWIIHGIHITMGAGCLQISAGSGILITAGAGHLIITADGTAAVIMDGYGSPEIPGHRIMSHGEAAETM